MIFLHSKLILAPLGSGSNLQRPLRDRQAGSGLSPRGEGGGTKGRRSAATGSPPPCDLPLVFPKGKDRPVVITALAARAGWLLTLDREDFHQRLGREVCGLRLATPGKFLLERRARGLIQAFS